MQTRARIGFTLLALAVTGGLIYGLLPRALPVDAARVTQGPLAVAIEEEGKTRVMERYVVAAPMTGYVRRIDLNVGDAVKANQVLASIEPTRATALDPRSRAQAQAQLKAAEASLAAAKETARAAQAQAELAGQDAERAESLRKSNFVSEQALDKARGELRRSQAVHKATEHSVNVAQFELGNARAALVSGGGIGVNELLQVRAPANARVLKLAHESEGPVQAGQPLLEIGDPDTLEIEVEVLSTQAVRITPGAKVLIDRWGGDALQGAVRVVEPSGFTKISALGVEEQRVRVIVDITSPREAWRRLGDGYRVEARFIIWEGAQIMQIPASALFRYNGGWAVFAIVGGHAKRKPVELGQRAGLQVEIAKGLSRDERIISHPDDKIRDGTAVTLRSGS